MYTLYHIARKTCVCVSRAFKWTNDLQDNKLVSMPVDVKEELLAAALLLPLAHADL